MNDITFNFLTIVVLAILIVSTLIGIKKGLLRTVLSLFSLIISLVFAWVLYPHVSAVLNQFEPLQQAIYKPVNEFFLEEIPDFLAGSQDSTGSPEQNTFIDGLPLPDLIKDSLTHNNTPGIYESLGAANFIEYLSTTVTSLILQGITILLTLLIAFIGLHLLMLVTDLVAKLPVIHTLNRLGGAVAGLITGYLIMQILFLLITTFSGTSWGMALMKQIHESSILTFLYNSSAIIKILFSQLTRSFQG